MKHWIRVIPIFLSYFILQFQDKSQIDEDYENDKSQKPETESADEADEEISERFSSNLFQHLLQG